MIIIDISGTIRYLEFFFFGVRRSNSKAWEIGSKEVKGEWGDKPQYELRYRTGNTCHDVTVTFRSVEKLFD